MAHPTESFTLAEITRRTGINPASAHALTAVLLRSGYLQRHPTQKTYTLGAALVATGAAALDQLPAIRAAQAEIGLLSDELQLEVTLTAPTDDEIIVVGTAGEASEFGSALPIGQRVPLNPPLGSVFLAWSTPGRIEQWLSRARPRSARPRLSASTGSSRPSGAGATPSASSRRRARGLGAAVTRPAELRRVGAEGRSRSLAPGTVDDLLAALVQGALPAELPRRSPDLRREHDRRSALRRQPPGLCGDHRHRSGTGRFARRHRRHRREGSRHGPRRHQASPRPAP